jgi:O-antigen/teichoic acid export membrane protein
VGHRLHADDGAADRAWQRLKASSLARNTAVMVAGGALRLLLQAVYFILIARSLGSGQYGIFVGVVSLIAVLSPFSTSGVGNLLIRDVARKRESFPSSWGTALWLSTVLGMLLLAAVLVFSRLILSSRVPLMLVFLVGLADLIVAGVVTLASNAFLAFEMLARTAELGVVLAVWRTVGAFAIFLWAPHPNATRWAVIYLLTAGISAVYALVSVSRTLGLPKFTRAVSPTDLREGFYFSVGVSSQSVYNNIDKTLMVRLAAAEAAGIYATAYRIIDLAFHPIAALAYSSYARFFQHGSEGITATYKYARRLLPVAGGYGVLTAGILVATAPMLPSVLGRDFVGADLALMWLSPLLVFRTTHYFLSNAMAGANYQGLRSIIHVAIAAFNVVLDLWLIPIYSWRGAAWASLASDGFLAVLMYAAIMILNIGQPTVANLDETRPQVSSSQS